MGPKDYIEDIEELHARVMAIHHILLENKLEKLSYLRLLLHDIQASVAAITDRTLRAEARKDAENARTKIDTQGTQKSNS